MKQLIALVAIAAGKYGENQPAFDKGAKFPAPDDIADQIVKAGDAKLDEEDPANAALASTGTGAGTGAGADAGTGGDAKAPKAGKRAKVRLLVDSALGDANDVVEVAASEVSGLEKAGLADGAKEAVAYASTLPQNQA